MGRIRTLTTKRIANEMIKKYPKKFTTSFEKNKKIIDEIADVATKKFRNIISGYITKKIKNTN